MHPHCQHEDLCLPDPFLASLVHSGRGENQGGADQDFHGGMVRLHRVSAQTDDHQLKGRVLHDGQVGVASQWRFPVRYEDMDAICFSFLEMVGILLFVSMRPFTLIYHLQANFCIYSIF